MKAMEIYRELSKEVSWAQKPRKVRMAAARYYAGVDSVEDLQAWAEPQVIREGVMLPPVLSKDEVREIIRWR